MQQQQVDCGKNVGGVTEQGRQTGLQLLGNSSSNNSVTAKPNRLWVGCAANGGCSNQIIANNNNNNSCNKSWGKCNAMTFAVFKWNLATKVGPSRNSHTTSTCNMWNRERWKRLELRLHETLAKCWMCFRSGQNTRQTKQETRGLGGGGDSTCPEPRLWLIWPG